MSFILKANNLTNNGKGTTAVLKLPVGKGAPTLDKILFDISGTAATDAHITAMRLIANGTIVFQEGSGTLRNTRDTYRGIFTANSKVTLDFTEAKARNGAVEQLLASYPLSLLQDATVELDIAAGAPNDFGLKAEIEVRPPTNNPWILKQKKVTTAQLASGEQVIYLPNGDAGGKIKRIWIHEGTPGNITDVLVQVANAKAFETTRARLEHRQKQNGLTPQAGIVAIDFIMDGNLSGVLDTKGAPQTELHLMGTAADSYSVYYEMVDPIGK